MPPNTAGKDARRYSSVAERRCGALQKPIEKQWFGD